MKISSINLILAAGVKGALTEGFKYIFYRKLSFDS